MSNERTNKMRRNPKSNEQNIRWKVFVASSGSLPTSFEHFHIELGQTFHLIPKRIQTNSIDDLKLHVYLTKSAANQKKEYSVNACCFVQIKLCVFRMFPNRMVMDSVVYEKHAALSHVRTNHDCINWNPKLCLYAGARASNQTTKRDAQSSRCAYFISMVSMN